MSIAEIQDEIVEEFELFEAWPDKYEHIIELGKSLKGLPVEEQTEDNKVRGCQSNVWLTAESQQNGSIHFRGDSDALIVKGLVSLVLRTYNDHTPDEILEANPTFIERIGLQSHLSPTRSNGLAAMIKQIKFYALAFKAKAQQS